MSEPYLSEIRSFPFTFAPQGWAFCDGQLLAISQNQAVFSLLGTTFGGNGVTTFALPDLRSRIALHMGTNFNLGQTGGEEGHTIINTEMPTHIHPVNAVINGTTGGTTVPSSSVELASAYTSQSPAQLANLYGPPPGGSTFAQGAVGAVGGISTQAQPHENRMPYLVLTYAIALQGIFPSRN